MAQSETLAHSDQSPPSNIISDPSLFKSLSFSRLNAKAPEFVPTRAAVVLPPIVIPPPPGVFHVYQSPTFVPVPTRVVAQNHQQQHQQRRHHHYQMTNHQPRHHQYNHGGFGGEEAVEVVSDHVISSKNGSSSDESNLKILSQVEYYFSDLNLATTDHLMRFINKDPEGYVPLSVVLSFKKIKAQVSSSSQLATILRNSSKLVISEDENKVRRLHPLTEPAMEELQTRIVIAENLPEDHCHQNLMKIFSAVGSVKTIRTCQPQATNAGATASASRSPKMDSMSLSNKLHAFVEYDSVELAEKAVTELNYVGNWRNGLKVRSLLGRALHSVHTRSKKIEGNCEEENPSTSDLQSNEKHSDNPSHQSDLPLQSHDHTGEDHVGKKEGGQKKGRNQGRGKGGRGWSPHPNNNNNNNRGNHVGHNNNRGNHVGTPPTNNSIHNEQPSISKQPPGPRMPDGTRGFSMGRGKPVSVNVG